MLVHESERVVARKKMDWKTDHVAQLKKGYYFSLRCSGANKKGTRKMKWRDLKRAIILVLKINCF